MWGHYDESDDEALGGLFRGSRGGRAGKWLDGRYVLMIEGELWILVVLERLSGLGLVFSR